MLCRIVPIFYCTFLFASVCHAANVPALPFVARDCWSGSKDCTQEFFLSGQLIFKNRAPNKIDCKGLSSVLFFEPDAESKRLLSGVLFYGGDPIKVNIRGDDALYQALEEKLPQWYKEGLLGEVQFFVKGNFYGFVPAGSACNGGWIYEIKARNIELHDKINESLSDKHDYSQLYGDTHFAYERILLKPEQNKLLLYKTPKGDVLATILPQAQNYGFLYRLDGDYSNHWGHNGYPIDFGVSAAHKSSEATNGWVKVIFFPPNETSGAKALVGYIPADSIRATVMSLDIIRDDPVILPPATEFQYLERPDSPQAEQDLTPPPDAPRRTIQTPY